MRFQYVAGPPGTSPRSLWLTPRERLPNSANWQGNSENDRVRMPVTAFQDRVRLGGGLLFRPLPPTRVPIAASVVLHKYLAHKGINAYIGVHGYNDQEVATATG